MDKLFEQIWKRKLAFIGTFFLVFTLTYIAFVAIDFLPEAPAVEVEEVDDSESAEEILEEVEETGDALEEAEEVLGNHMNDVVFPMQISIEKLDKVVTVLNPTSRTIVDLDNALLDGVVRHPDSATLNQIGNVFILGHSSYLPNVFNKNFQAFNGIQNLEWGDFIEVFSGDMVYEYRVEKVYRATAQDLTIPIAGTEKMLTLATCNSFGSVDDRYIVEAKQVSIKHI